MNKSNNVILSFCNVSSFFLREGVYTYRVPVRGHPHSGAAAIQLCSLFLISVLVWDKTSVSLCPYNQSSFQCMHQTTALPSASTLIWSQWRTVGFTTSGICLETSFLKSTLWNCKHQVVHRAGICNSTKLKSLNRLVNKFCDSRMG